MIHKHVSATGLCFLFSLGILLTNTMAWGQKVIARPVVCVQETAVVGGMCQGAGSSWGPYDCNGGIVKNRCMNTTTCPSKDVTNCDASHVGQSCTTDKVQCAAGSCNGPGAAALLNQWQTGTCQ